MLYISYFTGEGAGVISGLYPPEADTTDCLSKRSKLDPRAKHVFGLAEFVKICLFYTTYWIFTAIKKFGNF